MSLNKNHKPVFTPSRCWFEIWWSDFQIYNFRCILYKLHTPTVENFTPSGSVFKELTNRQVIYRFVKNFFQVYKSFVDFFFSWHPVYCILMNSIQLEITKCIQGTADLHLATPTKQKRVCPKLNFYVSSCDSKRRKGDKIKCKIKWSTCENNHAKLIFFK